MFSLGYFLLLDLQKIYKNTVNAGNLLNGHGSVNFST